jgi:hypothetical protein
MPKYVLFSGGADLDKRASNAALAGTLFDRYFQWMQSVQVKGKYIASYKLKDQTGARLTIRGGQVVEGPFIETKEAVGGLSLIEFASLDEAIAFARSCPVLELQNGYVEIRVVDERVPPGAR